MSNISNVGINIAEKATLIWNVADMLRGPFNPHEYIHKKQIAGEDAESFERLALTLNGVNEIQMACFARRVIWNG